MYMHYNFITSFAWEYIQVLNEQHKLNRVIETSGPPELAEAEKEVAKLQNELKMRTKLNELQSSKV